jgi:ribosomal protein L35
MTEIETLGYIKFLELRKRQAIANKKYRHTEKGKIKTFEMHRAWILTKKDDKEYKLNTNLKQRQRYLVRKLKKKAIADKENADKEIAEKELELQKIDIISPEDV